MSEGDRREAGERARRSAAEIRRRAEEVLRAREGGDPDTAAGDLTAVVCELRVHQIELEMQNEELLQAQEELQESRERYQDLYDFAPVGYVTMNEHGTLLSSNLTAARQLGVERTDLVRQPITRFILSDDQDVYYLHRRALFDSGGPQACDLRMAGPGDEPTWMHIDCTLDRGGEEGAPTCRATLTDISDIHRAEAEIRRAADRRRGSLRDTVQAMGAIVALRDPYTGDHERRVSAIADAIAEELGLDEHRREGLRMAGNVHDVGKIAVPGEILSKPIGLSAIEHGLVQQHAETGRTILAPIDFEWPIAEMVFQHHERLDGSGYPRGLGGDEIMLEARVLAVADVVEAMASHRPYRAGLGLDAALAELDEGAGNRYDADVVAACRRVRESVATALLL